MGYKIIYVKEKPKKHTFLRQQGLTALFLLLFSIFVRLSWPAGRAYLQQILVGESLSQAAEAMVSLLQNLEGGASIPDAVAVFCQDLIYGG